MEGDWVSCIISFIHSQLFEKLPLKKFAHTKMIPKPIRPLATVAAVITGGLITLNLASTATIKAIRFVSEAKRRKVALSCGVCRGKGFYICKLCKGNATIEWSPMYDPVAINPCLCPTCEGNRVQRCLNCLGKGYD